MHATRTVSTSAQGCSPRDRGLGLESTRDHFYAVMVLVLVLRGKVLVLVLILMVLVLVSVLKDWSRIFSRPVLYMGICFFGIFHRKKTITEIIPCIYLCDECSSC